jgi:hypothetical protein
MMNGEIPTREPDYTSPEGVKCWFDGATTYQEFPDGRCFKRVPDPDNKRIHVTNLKTGETVTDL